MSIESNIAELTAAVRELTAAILAGQGKEACAGKCSSSAKPEAEKPKAEAKKETAKLADPAPTAKPEAASTQPTATEPASAPEQKAENSAAPLDYEKDVKPLFLKLVSTKGRDVAIKLINDFKPGAAKLNDAIGPEQYAEAVAKINELLGG